MSRTALMALLAAAVLVAGLAAACVPAHHETAALHGAAHSVAVQDAHNCGPGASRSKTSLAADSPFGESRQCCREHQPDVFGETTAHQRTMSEVQLPAGSSVYATVSSSTAVIAPVRSIPDRAAPTPGELSISRT
jgi:hypothetical protein